MVTRKPALATAAVSPVFPSPDCKDLTGVRVGRERFLPLEVPYKLSLGRPVPVTTRVVPSWTYVLSIVWTLGLDYDSFSWLLSASQNNSWQEKNFSQRFLELVQLRYHVKTTLVFHSSP